MTTEIDFDAPAGLYAYAGNSSGRHVHGLTFRRFPTLAEAIRYAVEDMSRSKGAKIETDERDFDLDEILRAYKRSDFPLERKRRLA